MAILSSLLYFSATSGVNYLVVVLSYDFVVRGVLQDTEVLVDHEIPEIVCDIFDEDDGIHPVYQELRQFIERLSDAQ